MSLLSVSLRDGDWVKLRQILQHITHLQLGINSTPTFSGLTLSGLTQGSVLFAGASGLISQDNSNLFWDDTNNRLGIGTNVPDSIFHIKANVAGTVGSHPAGQLIIQDPDDTVFGNAVITGYESDGAGNPDQQLWYLGSSSSSNSNIIFLNRRNSKLQLGTNDVSRLTILGSGNIGIGTATPSFLLHLSKTNSVAGGTSFLRVTGLQVDGTAMTGTLRGAYIDVSNGSTPATGTIRAMELKARTEAPGDSGSDVNVLEGLSISADSKGHSVTTMRAAEFILDGSTGGTITEAVGLRIANNLQANKATTSYGLQIYRDSFDYTADIQLSGGGTIGGLSGVMKLSSAGLLEVISTAGAQLRLSYTSGSIYADFTVASDGDLRISPTGHLELYTTVAAKDIVINSADDVRIDAADFIAMEAVAGYFQIEAGRYMVFEADEYIQFYAVDEIRFQASGDSSDYIKFETAGDVPEITTVGTCDLKITASSGEINFDNENLTTTGTLTAGASTFGDGGATNYAQLSGVGQLTLAGTARVTKEVTFKAQQVSKGASAPTNALRAIGASGDVLVPVIEFSKTTQQDVHGEFHLPSDVDDSVNIEFHLMWIPGAGWTTGNYVWKLEYLVKNEDGDTTTGTPTTISMDVTPSNAVDIIETEFTDTIDANAEQIIFAHVYRDVASDNGDDTGDVIFGEVKYTSNKLGKAI